MIRDGHAGDFAAGDEKLMLRGSATVTPGSAIEPVSVKFLSFIIKKAQRPRAIIGGARAAA